MSTLIAGEILVRETFSQGKVEYTKNNSSQREITMSQPVLDALKRQLQQTGKSGREGYVFSSRTGTPVDAKNFTKPHLGSHA
jgi:integrase